MTKNQQFAVEVLAICGEISGVELRKLDYSGRNLEPDWDAIDQLRNVGPSGGQRALLALALGEWGITEGSTAWVVSACDAALVARVFEAQRAAYEPVLTP